MSEKASRSTFWLWTTTVALLAYTTYTLLSTVVMPGAPV